MFEYTGAGKYKPSEGYLQARIHLADVDGDGRFDYCAARDNGDIQCWRNGGRGEFTRLSADRPLILTPFGLSQRILQISGKIWVLFSLQRTWGTLMVSDLGTSTAM